MLEAIRKRSASILVKLLFALLILSFAAWGIGDMIRGRASIERVAQVGDVDITPDQLNREFQRELDRLQPLFGGRLDRDQARNMGLVNGVLKEMIDRTAFNIAAGELGVLIGDDLLRTEIRGNPAFQNTFATFDRFVFEQTLRNNGLSESGYIDLMRGDMARGQLLQGFRDGATAPKAMLNALFRYRAERRIAETVFVASEKMTRIEEPGEDDLITFHKENATRFTAPEYRALTVLTLLADDLAKEIAVPEERLSEAYEERRDEFNQPERRKVQQMVLLDEATARDALEKLNAGSAFADVAKEVAGMDAQAVELGLLQRDELLAELAEAVFSMPLNVASDPVQSPLGWHVLRVSEIEAGHLRSLDEVRGELSDVVAKELAIDDLFELSNKLEDSLGGGATLEESAARLNLKLATVRAVDATGRDPQGESVTTLPPNPQVLNVAFETPDTEESALTELGNDGYFIVRVDEVTPDTLRPLAEVSTLR